MDRPLSQSGQQVRSQGLRHRFTIVACGCMIGASILFPLANAEGFGFRAVTLSIFILSALCFHALHLKPFVRFGPFTAAVALIFLLVAVLAAGSTRTELIPWLPLFVASLSLITVAIYEISQRVGRQPLQLAELSEVSIDTWSEHSSRSMSTQRGFHPLLESNRLNPLFFALAGPPSRASPSRTSNRTGTDATDITLRSIVGHCRPEWDAQTRSHFADAQIPSHCLDNAQTERETPGDEVQRSPNPAGGCSPEPDMDVDSDRESLESSHPLLGPQGGLMA